MADSTVLVFDPAEGMTSRGLHRIFVRHSPQNQLAPHPEKLEHEKGGFNIFRRYRITAMQTAECPKPLQHFWSGHAQTHVSERYTKLLKNRDFRLEWAEKIGMGFELPARSFAPRTPLIMFRKTG